MSNRPGNPLGEWNLPYEAVPDGPFQDDVWTIMCDSVVVTAAVSQTPQLGRLPVIVFDFGSSALPADSQPPRLTLVGTAEVLTNFRKLVAAACNSAIRVAETFGTPRPGGGA